jgi:hypothetical protein
VIAPSSAKTGSSAGLEVTVIVRRVANPDWNLSGASLAALQYAEWLTINDGRADNFVDQYQTDAERAWAAAEARGWVETVQPKLDQPRRLGERLAQPTPKLTGEGLLKVEEVHRLRRNRLARASACREAVLLWLADAGQGASSLDRLVEQNSFRFYSSSFTIEEVNEAGKFLVEVDLISAIETWGSTFVRPALTARGQQCVEFFDANVRAFLSHQATGSTVTYNQNFNAPVSGQVAQGETVKQTQDNEIDAVGLAEVFSAMRQAMADVADDGDRGDVSHAIRELEAAVVSGDRAAVEERAGRLKRLGSRVGSIVLATATAAGTTQILQLFGIA